MAVIYHVAQHDEGFAYRMEDVWSETFASHEEALQEARAAASRQRLSGEATEITFQDETGAWQTQEVSGEDRPATGVIDDT